MPINFSGDASAFPNTAFFPAIPTLDEVIAELPGLLGAWDARDYAGSGDWRPRVGDGLITPSGSGTPPTLATRWNRPILRFVLNSRAFVNNADGSPVAFTSAVYASRGFYPDTTTNFTRLFDFGDGELYFRPTLFPPCWQWAGIGTQGRVNTTFEDMAGWNSVVFDKHSDESAALAVNGRDPAAIGFTGEALSGEQMVLGDATTDLGVAVDITRLIICTEANLSAESRIAIETWIGG